MWSQQDAEFKGGEIEIRWDVWRNNAGHWQLFGFYDRVKAELSDGSNVPRIPPQRFGLGLDWDLNAWAANFTWINADAHTETAEFETPTPGYDLLDAELSYEFALGEQLQTWTDRSTAPPSAVTLKVEQDLVSDDYRLRLSLETIR